MTTRTHLVAIVLATITFGVASGEAKSGNAGPDTASIQLKKNDFSWFPIVFWTPETKFLGGVVVSYVIPHADDTNRPTEISVPFIYTQKQQVMSGLEFNHYWDREDNHIAVSTEYVKMLDEYYGVGNALPESNREKFTPASFSTVVRYDHRLVSRFYVGVKFDFNSYRVAEAGNGSLVENLNLKNAVVTSGAGPTVTWDTRSSEIYPRRGSYHQVSVVPFHRVFGSEKDFTSTTVDLRHYIPLFTKHVLALQAYGNFISGHAPVNRLALLGGNNVMRGYYPGRYRDHDYIAVQAEYRLPLAWRFGMTAFGGWGDVAHRVNEFSARDMKYTAGLGIRFALDRTNNRNIRLDLAFGKNSAHPVISIGEAF